MARRISPQERLRSQLMMLDSDPTAQKTDLTAELRRNATVLFPGDSPNRPVRAISPPGTTSRTVVPADGGDQGFLAEQLSGRTGPPFLNAAPPLAPQGTPVTPADPMWFQQNFKPPPDDALTPPGQMAPSEMKAAGGFMRQLGTILSTPAGQKFLGQMGIAVSGGRPDQVGTILGQYAIEGADANAEDALTQQLMRGTPMTQQERLQTAGISPEARVRAETTAAGRRGETREDRRLGLQERDVASLITSRERASMSEAEQLELAWAKHNLGLGELDFAKSKEKFSQDLQIRVQEMNEELTAARVNSENAIAELHRVQARAGGYAPSRGGSGGSDASDDPSLIISRVSESASRATTNFFTAQQRLKAARESAARLEAKKTRTPVEENTLTGDREMIKMLEPQVAVLQQNVINLNNALAQTVGATPSAVEPPPTTGADAPGSSKQKPVIAQSEADALRYPPGTWVLLNGKLFETQ